MGKASGGVFDLGLVLVAAQQDADGRLVAFGHHVFFKIVQVKIHLPGVAVGEGADLQVEQHMAAEPAVIEDEIHAVMLVADGDAKLPRLETKAGAEFEEETLHVVEQRSLKVVFRIGGPVGEPRRIRGRRDHG